MYQRIMVAIDSNFAAGKGLDTGIEMARRFGARLALCHALDDTMLAQQFARVVLPDGITPIENFLRSGATEFLVQAADMARAKGIEAEIRLIDSETEHVPELLVRAAAEWQADLLIVGKHASVGVERLLGGSVSEQLVRKAAISLLLVHS
jgi:nucleotide-binding universal stress UspA family protein